MRVATGDPLRRQFQCLALVPQYVNRKCLRCVEVTAFSQHSPRAHLCKTLGSAMEIRNA